MDEAGASGGRWAVKEGPCTTEICSNAAACSVPSGRDTRKDGGLYAEGMGSVFDRQHPARKSPQINI